MTIYAVALLSFIEREAYNRYQARFMDVFRRCDGRLLAADECPIVIEGNWDRDKVVLLSFPREGAFRQFFESPEYQEIAKHRKAGADTILLLIRGISP